MCCLTANAIRYKNIGLQYVYSLYEEIHTWRPSRHIPVKEFWKSINSWYSYDKNLSCLLFFFTARKRRDACCASAVFYRNFVSRPYVCPSVYPSVCNVDIPCRKHTGGITSKLITRIISLVSSLLGITTSAIYSSPKGTPLKFEWNGVGLLFSAGNQSSGNGNHDQKLSVHMSVAH